MSIFQDESLTQGQRLVWFAIQELASGDLCRLGPSEIADHMGSARAHVSRCIQVLSDRGWIERTESGSLVPVEEPDNAGAEEDEGAVRDSQSRNRDSESRDSQSRKGFPAPPFPSPQERISFNPPSPSHLTLSQEVGDADATPLWVQQFMEHLSWQAKPLPDDHPARWDYLPGDWRWEAGMHSLSQMCRFGCLNTHYRKRLLDGEHPGKIAAEWGDVFRKLAELDGWKREEVALTMKWLWETDNWWRQKGVVQSAASLRRKDDEGTMKFDKILQSAISDYEQRKRKRTDPDAIRQGFEPGGGDGQSSRPAGDSVPAQPKVAPGDFTW